MNNVVVDLEWNQAMSSKSSVFNKLPIHLRGEIIQIGAVRLNEDMTPGEEFQIDVKPVYFKRMHYKVKKLTGFDKERLSHGVSFPEALQKFREWCGDDVVFYTWGFDDQGIMEQNIIIHDLDWDWIKGWINLQLIYNMETDEGDRNQKSLSTAMEHFGIEQTRVAHDALGDAYNTGLVCSKLNMGEGLEKYERAVELFSRRPPKEDRPRKELPEPIDHAAFSGYSSKGDAFADARLSAPACPICGAALEFTRWVNQGDHRYMCLAECPEDGKLLLRIKFKHTEDGYSAGRLAYRADENMQSFYAEKSSQPRSRSRSRRRRKKISNI